MTPGGSQALAAPPGSGRPQCPSPLRRAVPCTGSAPAREGAVAPTPRGQCPARRTAPPPRGVSARAGPRDRVEHRARQGHRSPGSHSARASPGGARPPPTARSRPLTRSLGRGPRSRRGAGSSGSEAAAGLRRARRAGPVYTRDRRRPRPAAPPRPAARRPPCAGRECARFWVPPPTRAPLNAPAVPSHRALICRGQTPHPPPTLEAVIGPFQAHLLLCAPAFPKFTLCCLLPGISL